MIFYISVTIVEQQVFDILKTGRKTPMQVAELLWPDSKGWNNSKGAGGLARCAGRILHRLRRKGLVELESLESNYWRKIDNGII